MLNLSDLKYSELRRMRRWHIAHKFDDDGIVYQRFIDEIEAELAYRRARTIFWCMVVVCCVSAFAFIGAALGVLETPH
jgi:hypothetical protein